VILGTAPEEARPAAILVLLSVDVCMCSLWTCMNVILSMNVMLCIYGCDEYCDV
jgi:hypothetical protein